MKISFTPSRNNVSFGYNKKLNQDVISNLKKYPNKNWANAMLDINNQCNSLEDILIRTEENDKETFQDCKYLFLELKSYFADLMSIIFLDLHYADRESKHYDNAYRKHAKCSDDWRKEACYAVGSFAENPPELYKQYAAEITNELTEKKLNTNSAQKTSQTDESSKKPKEEESKLSDENIKINDKYISKYVPGLNAPKGFEDVAGMEDVKEKFNDGILQALKNPEEAEKDFEEYGIKMPRGILLYGPPGCGKTFISEALAQEAGVPMYQLKLTDIGSSYINASSKNLKEAFDEAIRHAKITKKPTILKMEEVDTIGTERSNKINNEDSKMVGTFLQCMDEAEDAKVFVIGTTNKFQNLDPALRRRFDSKAPVSIPEDETIQWLVKHFLSKVTKGSQLIADDDAIKEISKKLYGYSNDSIVKISMEAGKLAKKRNRDFISKEDYFNAIKNSTEEKPDLKLFLPNEDLKVTKGKIGFNK